VNEKTTVDYWNRVWRAAPHMRLPSGLNVATRNLQALLRAHVAPGMRLLEIGCAPGKLLAWAAARLRAEVAGLDYSEPGLESARQLFSALGLRGDLRREDLFATTFAPGTFDLVFSAGVIEHFNDPRDIVRKHAELAKPGGKALIAVPHYGGVYGRVQRYFDADNLALHNLAIMSPRGLEALAPAGRAACAYPAGRLSPWLINLDRRWPRPVARAATYALNAAGLIQPIDIPKLCPMLVLEIRC
jgi:2-polyprenyl-3-methyl-5-hydroxy-6-metoxy-1,4-benzoquinol methylase